MSHRLVNTIQNFQPEHRTDKFIKKNLRKKIINANGILHDMQLCNIELLYF